MGRGVRVGPGQPLSSGSVEGLFNTTRAWGTAQCHVVWLRELWEGGGSLWILGHTILMETPVMHLSLAIYQYVIHFAYCIFSYTVWGESSLLCEVVSPNSKHRGVHIDHT